MSLRFTCDWSEQVVIGGFPMDIVYDNHLKQATCYSVPTETQRILTALNMQENADKREAKIIGERVGYARPDVPVETYTKL